MGRGINSEEELSRPRKISREYVGRLGAGVAGVAKDAQEVERVSSLLSAVLQPFGDTVHQADRVQVRQEKTQIEL